MFGLAHGPRIVNNEEKSVVLAFSQLNKFEFSYMRRNEYSAPVHFTIVRFACTQTKYIFYSSVHVSHLAIRCGCMKAYAIFAAKCVYFVINKFMTFTLLQIDASHTYILCVCAVNTFSRQRNWILTPSFHFHRRRLVDHDKRQNAIVTATGKKPLERLNFHKVTRSNKTFYSLAMF